MQNLFSGIIVSFREGLEAFLILILIFRFLEKTNNKHLTREVIYGFVSSILFSLFLGFFLFIINLQVKRIDEFGKFWESLASLVAVSLIISFIRWMINHGSEIKKYVENKASLHLSPGGIFLVSFFLVAREGVEIVLFSFAGQYHWLSIFIGILLALFLSVAVYFSIMKVKIETILAITLVYLIIQAGYLAGYGVHEMLASLKTLHLIDKHHPLLIKVFDLSSTILDHKQGLFGLPLNILLGWYSKPEWLQFILHYTIVFSLFGYWFFKSKNKENILFLSKDVYNKIIQHARRDLPLEACGYMAGKENTITEVFEMTNIDKSSEHFSFDPKEQFDVHKKVRNMGLKIIGVYHSHPSTPARMSEEDRKLAYDKSLLYAIVSLSTRKPIFKIFRLEEETPKEEKYKLI
ncbi:Mov34/MPN/PAD-1 family protein [Thermospira aquatica]|uniref:Mov34/MPN/PAD-1 family protein n=1 Tax=Thermospira aquatica TaxID=2828656 RepID=A0AAX3BAD2_9SPIR|nr:Mov34/MPN/PAD-1 family protein [Thermospira aquatica]URA09232.1 Mov34/MPN/PAD-1 family protein [Thermospira aquatica]